MQLIKQNGKWVEVEKVAEVQMPKMVFSGKVKVDVVQGDKVVKEGKWQKNLLLDSGLDQLASTTISQLFRFCSGGVGNLVGGAIVTSPTTVNGDDTTPDTTFGYASGTGIVTASGTIPFFAGDATDEGKLIHFRTTPPVEAYIVTHIDTFHVNIGTVSGLATSGMHGTMYSVNDTTLNNEVVRTNFCTPGPTYNFQNVGTATAVGSALRVNQVQYQRTFQFPAETSDATGVADPEPLTNQTYSMSVSGTVGTVNALTYDPTIPRYFQNTDVGKLISFDTSGKQYQIITVASGGTSSAIAGVAVPSGAPIITSDTASLISFNTYTEVGFSDADVDPAATVKPVNIRVKLSPSVQVFPSINAAPSQQLRVTYSLTVTASPPVVATSSAIPGSITTTTDLSTIITWIPPLTPPTNGKISIENMQFSDIDDSGDETATYDPQLDPSFAPYVAVSKGTTPAQPALIPFRHPSGSRTGAGFDISQTQQIVDYTPGNTPPTCATYFDATFEAQQAQGNINCFMMCDSTAATPSFTLIMATPASLPKLNTFSFLIRFVKTWGRDLT